jgi:hypothetical protein
MCCAVPTDLPAPTQGATSGQDEGGRQQSAAPDSDYTHREPAYSQASRESGQKRARPGSRSSGAAAQAPSGPVLQEVGPSRSGGLQVRVNTALNVAVRFVAERVCLYTLTPTDMGQGAVPDALACSMTWPL